MSRASRRMRFVLAALLLAGDPAAAWAQTVYAFKPVAFLLQDEVKRDACTPGIEVIPSNAFPFLPPGSPAPGVTPYHNSFSTAPSVWGTGWHEGSDAVLTLAGNGVIAWTDGLGAERDFKQELPAAGFQLPNDRTLLERLLRANGQPIEIPALQAGVFYAGDPTYKSPIGTFETLVYSSGAAAKVPTELRLESVNGDKTTFRVFESTALLRPALMADRNGNTLAYARDAQGRLIKVTDVHGRFTALSYNAQGLVASLSDHALRTVSYGYDAQGRKTSEAGPEGTTSYLYDGASARIAKITYPNGSFRRYE